MTRNFKRTARWVAGVLLALVGLSTALLMYCVAMPGKSFRGPSPPLTQGEKEVAGELRRHVEQLSVEIGPRRAVVGDSLQRAERYLREELAAVAAPKGLKLHREPLRDVPGDAANLVLELPGSGPGPSLIVGAHYDTAPGGTRGANDNGSGTAAALVLARRLAAGSHALPIRIVLFANEEQPYFRTEQMGSFQYASACRARGEPVMAMFSLETMGYYADEPGSQKYPWPLGWLYPDRGNFIAFVGNLASRGLVRDVVSDFRSHATIPSEGGALPELLPGVGWSDQWSFWHFGYPALMVTDTAPFRDPTYHRKSDIALNLDYDRLARVVVGLEKSLQRFAAP